MNETYFSKFPLVSYNGLTVTDITRRAKIPDRVKQAIGAYYEYDNSTGLRADQIAGHYYGHPNYHWLVYMSAGVVDPYYDRYLQPSEFFDSIEMKYGSYEDAYGKIAFWRLNWPSDEAELSNDLFQQTVPPEMRKYYNAVYLGKEVIGSWVRAREDWTVSTNRIALITLDDEPDTDYTVGERLSFSLLGEDVATAEVEYHDGTSLWVKNTQGTIEAGQTVTGSASAAAADVSTIENVSTPIPAAEYDFWSPVTFWDMETEINESKRFITLIDTNYAREISDDMEKFLQGRLN